MVELSGRGSCCTVSSSSRSIACDRSIVGGLRPLETDCLCSSSIACPHFQQNAYLASIIEPQSTHALAPGCSFDGAGGAGVGTATGCSRLTATGGGGGCTACETTGFGFGCSLMISSRPVAVSAQSSPSRDTDAG